MRHPSSNRVASAGSVFIVVLVVSLGLVSMALFFGHSMSMAYRGTDNNLAGRQADQAIEGAARYAEYLMNQGPGSLPDPSTYEPAEVPLGDATFWFIGSPISSGSASLGSQVDQPVFALVDEASKLNLNTASLAMLQELMQQLPGMPTDLADAIVAWRKPLDDTSTPSTGYSFSTGPAKGAPFESVFELATLTGTDQRLLFGQDSNFNHVLEPEESDAASSVTSGNLTIPYGLLEYVTAFSREPNTKSDGTPRIPITARDKALEALLTSTLGDAARANQILTAVYTGKKPPASVLEFYVASGMTEEEFAKISSSLISKPGAFLKGLINVNTASVTVLACVPGIGPDKAAQLVAARQSQTTPSTNLAWVVPILTPAGAKLAGPYLTTQTYQVCADVAAVGHNGRGYRRTQFILDSSTGSARIVYRRNLAALGWALGSDAKATLALSKDSQ